MVAAWCAWKTDGAAGKAEEKKVSEHVETIVFEAIYFPTS